ncbi:MAG: VCBS repeat-containing protein [Planctomycetales bacterium]|nr:VCBS repeat-containing protein [Planctomycetales bacterium]
MRSFSLFVQALLLTLSSSTAVLSISPEGPWWELHVVDDSSRGADGVKLADINGDGLMDVATGWEEGDITRVYLNPGGASSKQKWPAVTVGKTPQVEDAVFVDLDADGATDVVSCCEGKTRTMFVHWGPKQVESVLDPEAWSQAAIPQSRDRMQWMFAWPMQVDGRYGVDLIAGGKNAGGEIGWFEAPANPRELEAFRWHPISPVGWTMSIWNRDMDGDNDIDVVVSDRYGQLSGCRWLENPGPGPAQSQPWRNHFMGGRDNVVLSMVLTDLDLDGLEDALVAVVDFKILFLRRLDKSGLRWETHEISADYGAGKTRAVAVGDLNCDGRKDIAFTTWGAAGIHGVMWLENTGNVLVDSWRPHPISGTEKGIKFDRLELLDLDADGDLDLLTCEEQEGGPGLGVFWYENPMCQSR